MLPIAFVISSHAEHASPREAWGSCCRCSDDDKEEAPRAREEAVAAETAETAAALSGKGRSTFKPAVPTAQQHHAATATRSASW
mmetsp:Transcript_32102/g.81068  ORF Transcript_32102/g.81068 Transcript_32102/m.81068 type:complete len:84 (-) Transcript_32102:121-372(-)